MFNKLALLGALAGAFLPLAPARTWAEATSLSQGELRLSVREAVLMALEHNPSLKVQRLNPALLRTSEQEEQAAFLPRLSAELSVSRSLSGTVGDSPEGRLSAGLSELLPSGTEVEASVSGGSGNQQSAGLDLKLTQSLLQGAGATFNLARVNQARLEAFGSRYELKGFAESLVAEVETAYWEHYLARTQVEIYRDSLRLAERQLQETLERIQVGKLSQSEKAASAVEVASRRGALLAAENRREASRLKLLSLILPQGGPWEASVELLDRPPEAQEKLEEVGPHVEMGLRFRPDLNQARLSLQRGELELARTRNGLLPKLDLFISLGKTAYADSFSEAFRQLLEEPYGWSAGLSFEYPLGGRAAEAKHERARLSQSGLEEGMQNLKRLIERDVRTAHLELSRAAEQTRSDTMIRLLQEEKLQAESEKFRSGKSSTFLVAQSQRDLLNSQLAEVEAAVSYLRAMISLYRLEGSLLERRGISLPEAE